MVSGLLLEAGVVPVKGMQDRMIKADRVNLIAHP